MAHAAARGPGLTGALQLFQYAGAGDDRGDHDTPRSHPEGYMGDTQVRHLHDTGDSPDRDIYPLCEFDYGANSAPAQASAPASNSTPAAAGDGFMNIPDGIEEELPFN